MSYYVSNTKMRIGAVVAVLFVLLGFAAGIVTGVCYAMEQVEVSVGTPAFSSEAPYGSYQVVLELMDNQWIHLS